MVSSNFNIHWCSIRQNRYTDSIFPNDFIFISKYIFSLVLFYTSEQQSTPSNHLNVVVAYYCILDNKELVKINIYLQSSLRYLIREVLYGLYRDFHIQIGTKLVRT